MIERNNNSKTSSPVITEYNIHHFSKHIAKIVEGPITGTYTFKEALSIAKENNLDLILIKSGYIENGNQFPAIVKILDYNKFLYLQKKQEKNKLKKQRALNQKIKEVKMHIGIGENDLNCKLSHIKKFIDEGDKVKCQIVLRGRENSSTELIKSFIEKLSEKILEIGEFSKNFERQKNQIFCYIVKGNPK